MNTASSQQIALTNRQLRMLQVEQPLFVTMDSDKHARIRKEFAMERKKRVRMAIGLDALQQRIGRTTQRIARLKLVCAKMD